MAKVAAIATTLLRALLEAFGLTLGFS